MKTVLLAYERDQDLAAIETLPAVLTQGAVTRLRIEPLAD